jgi:hypothetical protein
MLLIAGVSACSSPESETPISLPDGRYAVIPGGVKEFTSRECLIGTDAEKVTRVVRNSLSFGSECTHKPGDRVGNVISGAQVCTGGTVGPGSANAEYKARINEEGFIIESKLTVLSAQGTMNEGAKQPNVPIFEARRLGDC